MVEDPHARQVASALLVGIGLLRRRLRQTHTGGELTLPEISALARLDRGGPTTSAALAKLKQISPQSMGATLAGLEARGLVERAGDPADGRRVILSITEPGLALLWSRRNARTEHLARALADGFGDAELRALLAVAPLLERLGER